MILVSTCFSAFASLVQLKLFSTSQPWVVCRNVQLLFFVLYSSPLRSKSSLVHIIPGCGQTSHLCAARGHVSCLACCPRDLSGTPAEEPTSVMFTFGNRSISSYAIHAIYASCQKRSSDQYSTVLFCFISPSFLSFFLYLFFTFSF